MIEIHPNLHPILVHFTLALFTTAALLTIMHFLFHKTRISDWLYKSILVNIWAGALFTIGTLSAGFYAFYTVSHTDASHAVMVDHRNWASVSAFLIAIVTIWSIIIAKRAQKLNLLFTLLMVVTMALLAITGYKGGEMVYVYGVGVQPLSDLNKVNQSRISNHHHSNGHNHQH